MDIPRKLMNKARAQQLAMRDQHWMLLTELRPEIERIRTGGASKGDEVIIQAMADMLSLEIMWRAMDRALMDQGVIPDE